MHDRTACRSLWLVVGRLNPAGHDPDPPPVDTIAQEDAAASSSVAGLIAFIQTMIASLTLESNEPRNIGGITPPVTEVAEPTAI